MKTGLCFSLRQDQMVKLHGVAVQSFLLLEQTLFVTSFFLKIIQD